MTVLLCGVEDQDAVFGRLEEPPIADLRGAQGFLRLLRLLGEFLLMDRRNQQRLVHLAQGLRGVLALMGLLAERVQLLYSLVGGRGERAQAHEHPQVFTVELAAIIMRDRPDRADRFPLDIERNQQALFDRRRHRQKIGVAPLEVPEQQGTVAIEHVAARAEVARRASADVRLPHAGDRRPVEPFSIFRHEADPGRVGLEHLQDRVGQCLKNGARRIGQRLCQRYQRTALPLIVRRTRWPAVQLLGVENRFQRRQHRRDC